MASKKFEFKNFISVEVSRIYTVTVVNHNIKNIASSKMFLVKENMQSSTITHVITIYKQNQTVWKIRPEL